MHIGSYAGAASPLSGIAKAHQGPEAKEGPGPDHDGDGDDVAALNGNAAKSLASPGVGTQVDISA